MSDNCQWKEIPSAASVGSLFELGCKDQFDKAEKFVLQSQSIESQKFALKLVEQKVSPDQALFKFSSYLVGKYSFKDLQLVSDGHKLMLPPVDFEIHTVLEAQKEKPQMLGPWGPVGSRTPISLWICLLLGLAALTLAIGFFWRQRKKKKEILKLVGQWTKSKNIFSEIEIQMRRLLREHKLDQDGLIEKENLAAIAEKLKTFLQIAFYDLLKKWFFDFHSAQVLQELRKKKLSQREEALELQIQRLQKEIYALNDPAAVVYAKDLRSILSRFRVVLDKLDRKRSLLQQGVL